MSVAAATALASAGAQSWAAWSVLLGVPVGDTLTELGSAALLTPFTAWSTCTALLLVVVSWTTATRDASSWWRPSAVGTVLVLGWTCAAWVDGARTTRALLDGRPSQTWFAWPGEATPLHWYDPLVPTAWSLDLLSATGPVVVLVCLWVGPLVLRDLESRQTMRATAALRGTTTRVAGAGTLVPLAPGPRLDGPTPRGRRVAGSVTSARAGLDREVRRAVEVAAAVWVLLCAGVALLQLSGGVFVVVSAPGGTGWTAVLDPGFLLMVLALSTAWRLGGDRGPSTALSPAWWVAVTSVLLAVAVTAWLVRSEMDLLMLVTATSGALVAATRTAVSTWAVQLLLGETARAGRRLDSGPAHHHVLATEAADPAGCPRCHRHDGAAARGSTPRGGRSRAAARS